MLTTRRQALKTLTAAAIGSTAFGRMPVMAQNATPAAATPTISAPTGPFVLPKLPYAYDGLEPIIDKETMQLHHDKHHGGYVSKLNMAVAKEPSLAKITNVNDLIKDLNAIPESIRAAVRNNGGGHSNHSLFWETLQPHNLFTKEKFLDNDFTKALDTDIGGLEKLKEEMSKQGGALFGSGWVWLVIDGGKKLTIMTLPNQDSPISEGHYPVFGIDVWEHAYYLKYHNLRADYLKAIWGIVNWNFISDRYAAAMKS